MPIIVETQSLNHCIARGVPKSVLWILNMLVLFVTTNTHITTELKGFFPVNCLPPDPLATYTFEDLLSIIFLYLMSTIFSKQLNLKKHAWLVFKIFHYIFYTKVWSYLLSRIWWQQSVNIISGICKSKCSLSSQLGRTWDASFVRMS